VVIVTCKGDRDAEGLGGKGASKKRGGGGGFCPGEGVFTAELTCFEERIYKGNSKKKKESSFAV